MTDHPKPIARYDVEMWAELGIFKADDGEYMLVADHEAALAAKDARIAELEREAIKSADRLHEARSDSHKLSALRTAIEAKAARFKQQAKDAKDAGDVAWAAMCLGAASDLLALLEKKS